MRRRWTIRTMTWESNQTNVLSRAVQMIDWTLFIVLVAVVLVFGMLMAMGPAAVDAGVQVVRDAGVALARWLGREQTNLSFLAWEEGSRHNIWIMSSGIALTALALLPFLFPTHRPTRIAGALTLLIGVVLATVCVPWPSAYADLYPTGALIVVYSPVAALAAWHLLACRVIGTPTASERDVHESRRCCSVPVLLALGLFASPNYSSQRELVTRRLVCLDSTTGQRVWHTDVFTTPAETKARQNSYATPTPVLVEDGIVVSFGLGIAVVNRDGQLRWSKTFHRWIEGSVYGAGSSPVADGRAIYIVNDREFDARQPSRVTAYLITTGDELWSHAPSFAHDGYTTPVIHDDGDRSLLLTLTSHALVGYDTASGGIAWRLTTPIGQPVPSLIAEEGRLYVTGPGGYTAAYELRRNSPPAELWTSRRNPADVSSPVLYQGRLYTITTGGIMVSYDATSGKTLLRQRLDPGLGGFYASLAAADDKVYAVRSDGTTFVVAVEDTFRVLSESSLSEEIFATPAFGAECLLLRTSSALYCIGATD
jgi:outer membrane protein assembly factor BamB